MTLPLNGTNKNFFAFSPILLKLGEVVVHMDTTTSPSFNKIGLNKKSFYLCPFNGSVVR